MSTNLLIGYPDIPLAATTITATSTEDSSHPAVNVVTGPRRKYFQLSAEATTGGVIFDLGAATTKASEYYFLAGAKLLYGAGDDGSILHSSTDGSAWTARLGRNGSLSTATYSGINSEDLMCTASFNDDVGGVTGTAYRYWRHLSGTNSNKHPVRKIYCGSFFDMGRDPIYPRELIRETKSKNNRSAAYIFSLTWKGVSSAKITSFISLIGRYRDVSPVVLYTTTYHDVLNEYRTLHCSILDYDIKTVTPSASDITISFEELI